MRVNRKSRAAIAVLALPFLAACSETSVMDTFNAGKGDAPNESLVTTNQPLSMPPDMALRQPGAAAAPTYGSSNGLQVEQGQRATAYQAPPPPQPVYQPPAAQQQQPAWQNTAPAPAPAPQQQAYQQPIAPQPNVSPQDKIYYDNGVNPYNADGTRKKQADLDSEMREKALEKKRAQNPNYGTIFNMGELWSGN